MVDGAGMQRHFRCGETAIEPRILIAYALLALLILAAMGAIGKLRHNSHRQKYRRQRQRDDNLKSLTTGMLSNRETGKRR